MVRHLKVAKYDAKAARAAAEPAYSAASDAPKSEKKEKKEKKDGKRARDEEAAGDNESAEKKVSSFDLAHVVAS